ncbi:MAG: disulfide bond formation protein B [Steroidobacteraceae bacterium]
MLTRRQGNAAAFAACAGALAYAFYAQYWQGFVPCHLCIFQRVTLAATTAVFLVAALHGPGRTGARFYALLVALAAGSLAATAGRHVWIQLQPPGAVPGCGADLDFMLEIFPLYEVVLKVFRAGGECQKIDWTFLGLSMPAWVLMFAVGVGAFGLWNNLRREPQR